jgi:hypothetical protein
MTDTVIPLVIFLAGLGLSALGLAVFKRVRAYRRVPGWASSQPGAPAIDFSLTRYQPLFRLLSAADADFLANSRPCPAVARNWERSQRRVVRLYLKELATDFQALHRSLRVMVAHSPEHAHLLPVLFRQQVAFWRALVWIELRLTFGWRGAAHVNPEALAQAVEALCQELSRRQPTAAS